jgi:hypothetical protein
MTSNNVDVAGRGYETQLRVIPGLLIFQIDIFDMSGHSNNQDLDRRDGGNTQAWMITKRLFPLLRGAGAGFGVSTTLSKDLTIRYRRDFSV